MSTRHPTRMFALIAFHALLGGGTGSGLGTNGHAPDGFHAPLGGGTGSGLGTNGHAAVVASIVYLAVLGAYLR